MKKIIFLLAISAFIISSCAMKDEKFVDTIEFPIEDKSVSVQEIIYTQSSKYAKFFDSNIDNEISYTSSRSHPMQIREMRAYYRDLAEEGFRPQRVKSTKKAVAISINGKTIEQMQQIGSIPDNAKVSQVMSASSTNSGINDFYGQEVTFLIEDEIIRDDEIIAITRPVVMYIPKLAEILAPRSHEELLTVCPFDNYRLEWEADSNNELGMVIIVEWDGAMLGEPTRNAAIRRIDIVEDNGETVIKSEMFNDIPHLAIARVSIVRGNIDIVEIDDLDLVYKIFAESNASLNTIIRRQAIDFSSAM